MGASTQRYNDIRATIEPLVTVGMPEMQRSRAHTQLDALITDWLREAGDDETTADTIDILREELEAKIAAASPAERLQVLEIETLQRRVRALSRESFELGKKLVDGAIARDAAGEQGQALMERADALGKEVAALNSAEAGEQLARELQEISLEALYAIEKKAMSLRLNHYAQDRSAANPDEAPPKVTP